MTSNDYRTTLQLPRTDFPMRANLLEMEPRHQQRWDKMKLYRSLQQAEAPRGAYVFHDGPPYANGEIHMGHLLNKILKDLVVRSRLMMGYHVDFIPGWDCHGLPIEHRVMKGLGEEGSNLSTLEVRRRCQEYAARFVEIQGRQMRRLGTLANYEEPYLTMDPVYEAGVLDVFEELLRTGIVYRDVKPVHWSIANQTALAEAELEYYEKTDTSIYALFPIEDSSLLPPSLALPTGETAHYMIWTTTPWTLPANQAVALDPRAEYLLCRYSANRHDVYAIVGEELKDVIFRDLGIEVDVIGQCSGEELYAANIAYSHPFMDRKGKTVIADYVTMEEGTGLVHTAPGHGAEDYYTGVQEGLPIYCPVQDDGTFDETVPDWLAGLDVWAANDRIISELERKGLLFYSHQYSHSYPHDWRSKTPTIFRATEQWFIAVDKAFGEDGKSVRQRAQVAAEGEIDFIPRWGQARLLGMLESRPDWCISRQRAWGLPIPAFYNASGEVLLTPASVAAVARVIKARGSDFWFEGSPSELLAGYSPKTDPDAPHWIGGAEPEEVLRNLAKGEDIFDVWFESGSSWNSVLRQRDIGFPADLYLEGSDQHRGWFQLSLLPSLGATGQSPFRTVLTHGFMVDGQGRKMSKSLGNTIEVADVLKQHGADICRWWVSSLNYTNDIKVDWDFFKVASDEYRKVRNTIRFLLGNLDDFNPEENRIDIQQAGESLDAWARQELSRFIEEVEAAYEALDFKRASEAIFNYCNETLSAVYLAAVKDRLYCDAKDAHRRRRTQTVLYEIASSLIRLMAPILVHTAEEAWMALNQFDMDSVDKSVHLTRFPTRFEYRAATGWSQVMEFRQRVLKRLEEARTSIEGLKNPLDAGVQAAVQESLFCKLRPFQEEMADLCGVSRFDLSPGPSEQIEILDLRDQPRCERSWKRDETVRERSDGGMLSDRDAAVVGV